MNTYGPNSFSHNQGVPGAEGEGGNGLFAFTWHNIIVNGATAINNSNHGFLLDNAYGNGAVTVHDSHAIGNDSTGITAISAGAFNINYSSFSYNAGSNAVLDNITPVASPGVTILQSEFNESTGSSGLIVYSKGAITLTDSQARLNQTFGAWIDNSVGTAGVSILYSRLTNIFSQNRGGTGLEITSKGAVSIKRTSASGNSGMGAIIDNCLVSGGVCQSKGGAVSIACSNFDANTGGYGLLLISGGAISLADSGLVSTVPARAHTSRTIGQVQPVVFPSSARLYPIRTNSHRTAPPAWSSILSVR